MTIENAKEELIRRYRYLYKNASFILAPFLCEESEEDNVDWEDYKETVVYLDISILDDINFWLEEFLFSDLKIEETTLYRINKNNKRDRVYLEDVKRGLELLRKLNNSRLYNKESLSVLNILNFVNNYILEQSGDLDNKKNKLRVLDEYYRIARYKNDGVIRTNGRERNLHNYDSGEVSLYRRKPVRSKNDIGIIENDFIRTIVNAPRNEKNLSIFTEKEKQKIYLDYHDELPCDLKITCSLEAEYVVTMIETRLERPENTSFCGEQFIVREEEIFVDPDDPLYRYYQLCPHCGYMVNIPKEILSKGVRKRIEDRCSGDEMLFRKMYLYSELFCLDKKATKGQKRLLKK